MKVLISPRYGYGWSTWNYMDLAFDPDIIAYFEKGATEEEMKAYICSLGYKEPQYMRGYKGCEVVDVPKGALFKIFEVDGSERIEIAEAGTNGWMTAV